MDKDEAKVTSEDTSFKFPNDFTFKFQRGYFSAIDKIKKSFYGKLLHFLTHLIFVNCVL